MQGPERPLRRSLQGKILLRALLISTIPLLLLGSVMLGSLLGLSNSADRSLQSSRGELARDVAGRNARDNATAVANEVERLLAERINDVLDWSRTPTIYYAARTAGRDTGDALADTPTVALEAQFDDDRRLGPRSVSERYLRAATQRQPTFSELFFTESNGLTVAASDRTTDFVQDDEEWWDQAWSDRLYLGPVEIDESTGDQGLTIAARIDDPETDERVGVFKATLNLTAVQKIASNVAEATGTEVSLLTREGQLLAETRSDHLDTRIMNVGLDLQPRQAEIYAAALDSDEPDSLLQDDSVAGFARLDAVRDDLSPVIERWEVDADAIDWVAVAEQSNEDAFAPLAGLADAQRGLGTTARTFAVLAVLGLLAALIAAFLVSTRLAESIVRPLRSLRNTAHDIADRQLPALIEQVQHAESDEDLPSVPSVTLSTDDEVEDVADAFNVVRSTAVTLAADQARNRRNVSRMFVSLGRRNQSLLSRQLEFIDRLEREEADPELLDSLFKLDHLATRMRRNAESLLVLAGEEPARLWSQPVALGDVVRGAVAEVEDYQRVNLDSIDDAEIVGNAASDVSHLLAELIENALHFSPPDSTVVVVGRRVVDGYSLAIVDDGVGMTAEQLKEVNERIASAPLVDRVPSSYLGLFVVGRLATRHDIQVRLVESTTEGVTVKVLLPTTLVDPLPVQRSLGTGLADPVVAREYAPIAVGAARRGGNRMAVVDDPMSAPADTDPDPVVQVSTDADLDRGRPSDVTIDLPALGISRRMSKRGPHDTSDAGGSDDDNDAIEHPPFNGATEPIVEPAAPRAEADADTPDAVSARSTAPAEATQHKNGPVASSSGLEVRRRVAKRPDEPEDGADKTAKDDRLVLRTASQDASSANDDHATRDVAANDVAVVEEPEQRAPEPVPVVSDASPDPADALLTQAERNARAARERLARFQRAVRQGRAQTSRRAPGRDVANGDRTGGGEPTDA